jgi:hypothetical protein
MSQEKPTGENASVRNRAEIQDELKSIVDMDTLDTENFHYRFVQERPQNMARKKSLGYTPVIEDDGVHTILGETSADGLIRDGDAVLMKVPKDRFKQRRVKSRKFGEARLAAPEQSFKSKAKRNRPGGKDIRVGSFDHDLDED